MTPPPPAVTIVNRHYPPNPGITGETAWDLATYLINEQGIRVVVVHIDRTYDGGGSVRQPIGETHPVRSVYTGKNGLLKLVSGLLDGWFLIRKAIQVRQGPVIVMTSPPLLPFWAARLLTPRRIDWWLWSMDLFPEGFVADQKISPRNPVYRWVIQQTYRRAPHHLIALGPQQGKYIRQKYGQPDLPTTVLPCGVLLHHERDPNTPAWRQNDGKIYLGYVGNLGQPHSAEFLLSVIRHLDPARFQLILVLYGQKADEVIRVATGRVGITLLPTVPRSQLAYVDVQLVSLLPSWTHIAVPSKAVSAVCAGSPVLYCGSRESDTYALLEEAVFLIETERPIDEQVANFLQVLTTETVEDKKRAAQRVAARLQRMITDAYAYLASQIRNWGNLQETDSKIPPTPQRGL
ncbi:MAG: hypothetical protein H7Z72_07250 [Bacteroidetes bacterium]|nr:hypothetical protein [Fibrella sp.]